MYEIEIKIELSSEEKDRLIEECTMRGLTSSGILPQQDYYIEAEESPFGGFNIKRYRNENGQYIYTEKTSEMIDGQRFRKEDERDSSKEEFDEKIAQFPNALKIIKDRESFECTHKGKELTLTIDTVKFDHSPSLRYFTEAEIVVQDKNEATSTREFLKEFLKDILNKQELNESPGMFAMAFKKL